MSRPPFLPAILALALLGSARADDDLPRPLPAERYRPVWTRSPFTAAASGDADRGAWALVGLTSTGSGPLAFLLNRQSQERMAVTSEPNAKGYAIAAVAFNPNPLQTSVQVRTPSETLTARFDPALMVVNNPAPAAPGQPPAPSGARPRPVVRAVVPNPAPAAAPHS